MKKTVYLVAFLLLMSAFVTYAAEIRTWTATNGRTIEAELVGISEGGKTVILRETDGTENKGALAQLSKEDQEYVKKQKQKGKVKTFVTEIKTVDFFDAKNQGLIEVALVARDSLNAQMQVTNLTDEPLIVNKPFAFGAVPVLAQYQYTSQQYDTASRILQNEAKDRITSQVFPFPNSNGSGGGRNQGGGGGTQAMGGGMGGRGGMGGGGGMFNIPPKKTVRENIKTVCLEHGKKEPNSRIKFDVKPISEVVEKPEIAILCANIGTGQLNQDVGQAAVWHLNSNMSWQQLAAKTRTQQGQPDRPYFTPQQMMVAQNAVGQVTQYVKENNVEFKKTENETTATGNAGGTTSEGNAIKE